jgi:hypothetical protein
MIIEIRRSPRDGYARARTIDIDLKAGATGLVKARVREDFRQNVVPISHRDAPLKLGAPNDQIFLENNEAARRSVKRSERHSLLMRQQVGPRLERQWRECSIVVGAWRL